jgi:hypothetical protein
MRITNCAMPRPRPTAKYTSTGETRKNSTIETDLEGNTPFFKVLLMGISSFVVNCTDRYPFGTGGYLGVQNGIQMSLAGLGMADRC